MAAALLIAVFARSQPTQVGAGEYYAWLLNLSTHKVVDMSAGVPAAVPGAPLSSQVACAYHHCALTDLGGNAWTWGNNTNGQIGNGTAGGGEGGITVTTCYEVTTDINGKPFTGIAQVVLVAIDRLSCCSSFQTFSQAPSRSTPTSSRFSWGTAWACAACTPTRTRCPCARWST